MLSSILAEDILESLPLGVVLVSPEGVVSFANSVAEGLLGSPAASVVGRPLESAIPHSWDSARRCLDDQASQPPQLLSCGGQCLIGIASPLAGADRPAGVLLRLFPPEEAARRELLLSLLEKSDAHFQAVLDSISDGIWVCDGGGTILSINAASERLNSIRAEQFVGRHISFILESNLVDHSVTLDVLREGQQKSLIQQIKRSGKQLLVTGTPVLDADGNVCLVVVNERDITELLALRTGLQNAQKVQEKYRSELAGLSMQELERKEVVAESPQMQRVLGALYKVAHMDALQVLILGESGTGKGLLAKLLHKSSPRAEKPFIQINCAALPEQLFEGELFGYERGAFTGASEKGKVGLIELAQGGTLFLDEIGDMPLAVQAKLLKYLDDHEIMRLGGNRPIRVDCRVVAATNRDLESLIRQKRFRKDLFYRLNIFTVQVPPLRERPDDLFPLAHSYLNQFNAKFDRSKRLSPRALRLLEAHSFPGNVRELVGLIQKAVVLGEDEDLYPVLLETLTGRPAPESARDESMQSLATALAETERAALAKARSVCRTTREMAEYLGVSQASVVRKLARHRLGTR